MQFMLKLTCFHDYVCVDYGCMDVDEGYKGNEVLWSIVVKLMIFTMKSNEMR